MNPLKRYDTRNLPLVRSKKSEYSLRLMTPAYITNSSGIKQDGTRADRRTFAEDFLREHSNSGRPIALIGIATSYGTAPNRLQLSAQSFGFPS